MNLSRYPAMGDANGDASTWCSECEEYASAQNLQDLATWAENHEREKHNGPAADGSIVLRLKVPLDWATWPVNERSTFLMARAETAVVNFMAPSWASTTPRPTGAS